MDVSHVAMNISSHLPNTGCFGTFNVMSCARDSALTLLAVVTMVICVFKVIKLHTHHHSLPNQYIIYYSGIINCILCALNWLYLGKVAVHMVTQFMKTSCQVLVVTHFHCLLAARMTRRMDTVKNFNIPTLIFLVIFMGITLIAGLATMKSEDYECTEPEWLLLSVTEFVLVQAFLASGIVISRELNEVRMQDRDRFGQKRDLWGIIFVFEISAIASVVHDIVFRITGPDNLCQGIFLNTQAGYTAIYITVKIIRWLLPLWAVAVIFGIEDNYDAPCGAREQVYASPAADDSGNFTSAFRPRGTSFNYKHIYNQTDSTERPLIPPFGGHTPTSRSPGLESYGSMGKSPKELRSGQTYPKI